MGDGKEMERKEMKMKKKRKRKKKGGEGGEGEERQCTLPGNGTWTLVKDRVGIDNT